MWSSSLPAIGSERPKARWGRARAWALVLHRYVGLFLVLFLVVAGTTGAFLAFYEELDAFCAPELFELPPEEVNLPLLEPFELTARVEAGLAPGLHYRNVRFDAVPERSISGWVEESPGEWREWFVSPKSGRILGRRTWGDPSEGLRNLMPFVYRLHYSLALDWVGTLLFGVAALLWTLDCFVGAYLTFPASSPGERKGPVKFVRRWLPAWAIRTNKLFAFVFTWHRASGLWVWALLFVFAWSGVGFNLRPVYSGVMGATLGMMPEGHEQLPHLTAPFPEPRLGLREARDLGRREMQREASERGFRVVRELGMYYADDHGAYAYVVESTLDISKKSPRTEIYLDGQTGRFLGFSAQSGISVGNSVSSWLTALHMGAVFGLWYRVAVAIMGLLVVGLSVTGAWIWWRKRTRARKRTGRGDGGVDVSSGPSEPPRAGSLDDDGDDPTWKSTAACR